MFICKINSYAQGNPDKKGKMPVYLDCANGELPQRARVLAGTIAENLGLEVGKIYAITVTHTGESEYGPTYRHSNFGVISTVEYLGMMKSLPKAELLTDIKTPVNPVVKSAVTVEEGDDADF